MKILTFTSLYPNSMQGRHGIFVENRLRHLLASGEVESRVVAPVPWFPFRHPRFGEYARFAAVQRREVRSGVIVEHPRYLVIPKIGMSLTPWSMARAAYPVLKKMISDGYAFDLIDAHYFYPDGVAAALVARSLGKPLVITARGTDLNLIPAYRIPRALIRWAAGRADAMITVCQALKDVLVDMGEPADRIQVLRNGVDLSMFSPPVERGVLRERLGMRRISLLSVGHLIKRKGHDLVISALKHLPDMELFIAGDGEEADALGRLAVELGVEDRVTFLGAVSHEKLRDYYGAADALVLASSREGWANVLLESMACGTPVVATRVWGTPEVVASPEAGVLADNRDVASIVEAVRELFENYPAREETRRYAENFGWEPTTRGQIELFRRVLGGAA